MKALEDAIRKAKGNARVIGKLLREMCNASPQAAELLRQDLENPEMSLEKCAEAMKAYAKKHQQDGCWSCCVVGFEPDNEAVRVILDFYKIPAEWFGGPAEQAADGAEPDGETVSVDVPSPVPAGGKIDLMSLL